jgi:hypothetical protein
MAPPSAAAPIAVAAVAPAVAPEEIRDYPIGASAPQPRERSGYEGVQAPGLEARPEPRLEPQPEPRREPRATPPPPPPPPAPAADLDVVLRDSGLVMIETDRGKVHEAEPEGVPQAPRQRRERRAPPPGVNEPLEQVETRPSDAPGEPRLP